MFDSGYKFTHLGPKIVFKQPPFREFNFSFLTDKKRKYKVIIEEYPDEVYAIKFCLKQHKGDPKRFNIILNDNDAPKVIRTVINVMIEWLKKHPKASFCFIGEQKDGEQTRQSTTRFRVYFNLASNYFGESSFLHLKSDQCSAYLLINNQNADPIALANRTVNLFAETYPVLSELIVN